MGPQLAPTRPKPPKLPLTAVERQALRTRGLRLVDFATTAAPAIAQTLDWPIERARTLCSLARFQQLPHIGPASAGDLVLLGFQDPAELIGQDAGELYRRLQVLTHSAQDPCVEDVFHCAIHHATYGSNEPEHPWWEWSRRRKVALTR